MDASGQITEQPVHRTGGEWARNMLAGALTGLAAGSSAGARPGAPALEGVGAGFSAERNQQIAQDQRKRQSLQQSFENKQAGQEQQSEIDLRGAQRAYLTTQNTSLGLENSRRQVEAGEDSVNAFNTYQKAIAADPSNLDLGVFPDMKAVIAYEKEHPELTKNIASGQLLAVPNLVQGEDGNWTYQGVHAALVKPNVLDQPISQVFGDKPIPGIPFFVPGKMTAQGQEPGAWQTAPAAASTKYGDYLALMQKATADAAKDDSALAIAQTKEAQAAASKDAAEAGLARSQTTPPGGAGGTGGAAGGGAAMPPTENYQSWINTVPFKQREEMNKRYDAFDAAEIDKNLVPFERTFDQMNAILSDANAGKLTGPESVVGLFDAIGLSTSNLKGQGMRINQAVIGDHASATNVWQQLAAKLSKLPPTGPGEKVTPQQLQQYTNIMGQARHDLYLTLADTARRRGLPVDFLPDGNGQVLDTTSPTGANTWSIFKDAYGGDAAAAGAAAERFGWKPPQAAGQ
jgi:hypothetical protein